MRRLFDGLYDGAAYLACVCTLLIFVTIMIQVGGSYFDLYVRGTDAIAITIFPGIATFLPRQMMGS